MGYGVRGVRVPNRFIRVKGSPTREEQKKEKHNGELPGWGSGALV